MTEYRIYDKLEPEGSTTPTTEAKRAGLSWVATAGLCREYDLDLDGFELQRRVDGGEWERITLDDLDSEL